MYHVPAGPVPPPFPPENPPLPKEGADGSEEESEYESDGDEEEKERYALTNRFLLCILWPFPPMFTRGGSPPQG